MKRGIIKAASIADVARTAGVSAATVSLVLNGRMVIARATREKVLSAVKALSYVPQPGGRPRKPVNMPLRTKQIALVISGPNRAMLKSQVYMDVLQGVEAEASERDHVLIIKHVCANHPCDLAALASKVDGVLLFGQMERSTCEQVFKHLPVVHFMRHPSESSGFDHVSYDNAAIGSLAAKTLLAHGHRRLAYIAASKHPIFVERGDVFARAIRAKRKLCTCVMDETLYALDGNVEQIVAPRMRAILDSLMAIATHPSALFVGADLLLPCLYDELRRRKLEPGRDMEVLGCNNEQHLLARLHPRPPSIDIHVERVGHKAVDQLLWRIQHPNEPSVILQFQPTLSEGTGQSAMQNRSG